MFGYVKIDKPELKVKEYEAYKGLYCSLCRAMKRYYGPLSTIFLSYDITFLLLLRLSLKNLLPHFKAGRCNFNPMKRCNYCSNADLDLKYCASVAIIMFYFKVKDNISDSSFFRKLLMYLLLPYAHIKYKKAEKLYPEIASFIDTSMKQQSEKEKSHCSSTDEAAHESARALAEILAYGFEDENGYIHRLGYGIGKWVYLCDAADDLRDDIKSGSYNVFSVKYKLSKNDDISDDILKEMEYTLNMSCSLAAEALENTENKTLTSIINNIIYGGMEKTMRNILKGKDKNERSL